MDFKVRACELSKDHYDFSGRLLIMAALKVGHIKPSFGDKNFGVVSNISNIGGHK